MQHLGFTVDIRIILAISTCQLMLQLWTQLQYKISEVDSVYEW